MSAYGMSCLIDVKHSLIFLLTHSLTLTHTHSCNQTLNSKSMKQTYYRNAKSEKRKTESKKRKTKRIWTLTKITSAYAMSCLMDVKHSLTHFLTHSLTKTLNHSCTQITVTTWHRPVIEKRKAKNEKRKAKNEKRKVKNKKDLDFDQMNVCSLHELFD